MQRKSLSFVPYFSLEIEDVQHSPHPLVRIFSVTLSLKPIYLKKKKSSPFFYVQNSLTIFLKTDLLQVKTPEQQLGFF